MGFLLVSKSVTLNDPAEARYLCGSLACCFVYFCSKQCAGAVTGGYYSA